MPGVCVARLEADPMHHFYSMPYYHHQTPYVYKPVSYVQQMHYKTYSNDAVKDEDYAAKGKYVAETAGSLHIAKREADPMHHFYSMPYYHHQTPYVYKPVTYVQPMHYKTYSNDAVKDEDYAAKGKYVAETAGSLHIAKREADPMHHFYSMPYYHH